MQYDFIGISYQSIRGIKNPGLILRGTVQKKKFSFLVKVDGKVWDKVETLVDTSSGDFTLTALLTKSCKEILVYVVVGKKEYLIYKGKNSLFRRIRGKVKDVCLPYALRFKNICITIGRGIRYLWREYHFLVPPRLIPKYLKDFKESLTRKNYDFYNSFNKEDYNKWLKEQPIETYEDDFSYRPLISIVTPVYNVSKKLLLDCVDSVLKQIYDNWELLLIDDCSTNEETKITLKSLETKDERIKVFYRKENGHISRASNDGIKYVKGEFISLLDNDDLLSDDALYQVVKVLNQDKKLDFIYSDEDKLDLKGVRCHPHFKSDFAPDTLLSHNYICHFTTIRKKLVDEVGGFEVGLEGAQDHDLFLKVTEKTTRICHIPKILYHWRMSPTSTSMTMSNKEYANEKGRKAVENALKRRHIPAKVEIDALSNCFRVRYLYKKEPKISIIIPTKDYASTLKVCLDSIYEKTTYKNFEVLIVNNNSEEKETFDLFETYQKKHANLKVIDANFEFNYSKINNMAVKHAKGEYLLLLNNDTEVITPDWLDIMVGYAMQDHIGAVGAKLYYFDDTVQHAGIILGLGGVAGHAHTFASRKLLGLYAELRVPYNYAGVTAACLMVSKKKFLEVGGLEEQLKVAYNDVDFNLKLLEKGYYNVCLPQVELHHFESKSRGMDTTSEKYKRFQQESQFIYDKWGTLIKHDPFYNLNFSLKACYVLDKKGKK